jgi:hypothetical protein
MGFPLVLLRGSKCFGHFPADLIENIRPARTRPAFGGPFRDISPVHTQLESDIIQRAASFRTLIHTDGDAHEARAVFQPIDNMKAGIAQRLFDDVLLPGCRHIDRSIDALGQRFEYAYFGGYRGASRHHNARI